MRAEAAVRRAVRSGVWSLLLLAAAAGGNVAAQSPGEGWLTGVVVEAGRGDPVAGAEVGVVGDPSAPTTLTDGEGRWRLGPLTPGRYVVRAVHIGFADWEEEVVVEASSDDVRIGLTPTPLPLDAMVVTASRREQRLADAPVATELVSAREIRETGAPDLASVLTERTGVELQGGHPAGAGLMIQGMGSERVLILMDGQPFIGRIAGTVDASRIPTSMIERVEVVKGPQSTLYGSEAMGGVVNVVTRAPADADWRGTGSVIAGERGRLDLQAGLTGGTGPFVWVGEGGRRVEDVVAGRADETGGETERLDGLVRVGWRPEIDGLSADLTGMLLDESQRYRSGVLYTFADNRQWSGRMSARLERGAHTIAPTLYATAFDHHSVGSTSASRPAAGGDEETQRLVEAELLYSADLGDPLVVDVGAEARRESIRSDRVQGYSRDIRTLEAFTQLTLERGPVTVVPGVRASFSDPWGSHWTPRVALLARPTAPLALRVSVGRGFRAPDFKELHMEFLNVGPGFGYTVRGNPDLLPESSTNVTAGAEWSAGRLYLRAQAFTNRFERFIETRIVGDSSGIQVYTYGNIDDGSTRGADVEVGFTWEGWRAEASYGRLRAVHGPDDEPLLGRPRDSGRASLGWVRPDGTRITLTGVLTGRTPLQRSDEAVLYRDPFTRFDARVARTVFRDLDLSVGVDNLFDAVPTDWPGFTGRRVYVGLTWGVVER